MVSHIVFDSTLPGAVIGTRYGPALVVLSVAIACLASYSALDMAERISASEKTASKQAWLWAGAWSMGIGVWAIHSNCHCMSAMTCSRRWCPPSQRYLPAPSCSL